MSEAQSPFLPGTKIQYAWSSIGLELIKTCGRKYQYTIIDGWATRHDSIHLRFGIEYHTALQDYAISRAKDIPHNDAIHDTVRALHHRIWNWEPDRTSRAGKYKNRESIVALVIDYLDHFADDPAETFILDNGEPAVELSFRFELDWGPNYARLPLMDSIEAAQVEHKPAVGESFPVNLERSSQPYLLCGHLDRVVNYLDDLYVMDRKTSISTIGSYYMDQWTPSNQMSLYSLAGKIMLNSPIKGVIIDAAQVLLDKPNAFARGFAYRTENQLTEWLEDLHYWLAQAETYATNNYWPQNDTACTKYGGCIFKEVCSAAPQVRDNYLAAQFDKTDLNQAWNPFFLRNG